MQAAGRDGAARNTSPQDANWYWRAGSRRGLLVGGRRRWRRGGRRSAMPGTTITAVTVARSPAIAGFAPRSGINLDTGIARPQRWRRQRESGGPASRARCRPLGRHADHLLNAPSPRAAPRTTTYRQLPQGGVSPVAAAPHRRAELATTAGLRAARHRSTAHRRQHRHVNAINAVQGHWRPHRPPAAAAAACRARIGGDHQHAGGERPGHRHGSDATPLLNDHLLDAATGEHLAGTDLRADMRTGGGAASASQPAADPSPSTAGRPRATFQRQELLPPGQSRDPHHRRPAAAAVPVARSSSRPAQASGPPGPAAWASPSTLSAAHLQAYGLVRRRTAPPTSIQFVGVTSRLADAATATCPPAAAWR